MKTVFKFLTVSVAVGLTLGVCFAETGAGNFWEEMETARTQMCAGRSKDVCRQNIECSWGGGENKCSAKDACWKDGKDSRTRMGCAFAGSRCQWTVPSFLSKKDEGGSGGAGLVKQQLNPLLKKIGPEYQIPEKWISSNKNPRGGICLSPEEAGVRACVDEAWHTLMWAPVDISEVAAATGGDSDDALKWVYFLEFKESVLRCFSKTKFDLDVYTGPTFSGPGLFGGAELARRQVSNSISKETDLKRLIVQWMKFALPITAVIAVIAIIWAGILWITDFGDGARAEQGKKVLMWTVAGILLILASYAIVNTVMRASWQDPRVNVTGTETRCEDGCFWDGYDCKPTIRGNRSEAECTLSKRHTFASPASSGGVPPAPPGGGEECALGCEWDSAQNACMKIGHPGSPCPN